MTKLEGKTLSIVIPAYNEEDAIEAILHGCLAARQALCAELGLKSVEVIAVNDGSRDRTEELARGIREARLINHPRNLGYGRALMTGFEAASGDYLGFLDADGTCDPLAFAALGKALSEADADLAVGMRLHPGSQMPAIRVLGNRFYAAVISLLTGVPVADSASGMRLFSRSLLARLSPMPSGLHFTPAMTARVACLGAKIVETPIPYADRQGQSKLNVIADGIRFLRVILGIIFSNFPMRFFGPAGTLFALIALAYGVWPVRYYLEHHELQPDVMIYRLLTIVTLAACSLVCLTFGALAQKAADLSLGKGPSVLDRPWFSETAVAAGLILSIGGVLLNLRTILQYFSTGSISIHWIYVLTGSLLVIPGAILAAFGVTLELLRHMPTEKK